MKWVNNNNLLKTVAHTTFWLTSIGIVLFLFYYNQNHFQFSLSIFIKAVFVNLGFALAVYTNLYILIPQFLKQKNYIFYTFWLILILTFSGLFIQLLLIYPLQNLFDLKKSFRSFDSNLHAAYFFASLVYVAFTSFLKFIKDWLTLQDLNLRLAKISQQKLEAELKSLKSQLNPHFLFNSLNNIYSLALINSEKVPELLLTLAQLMRHILYESREDFIPLKKEIEFVNNFIAMQRIRVSNEVRIQYVINGQIPDAQIAPLLFEPFIDNAFKHGLPGSENDFIQITFDLSLPDWLFFKIENNYIPMEVTKQSNGGIGIQNVKERLRHLYEASGYELAIFQKDNIHAVKLGIKLR